MKKLIYILTFLLSGMAFGQKELLTKEKFLKVNVTKYNLNDTIVPIKIKTIEFKDYRNYMVDNVTLINHLNVLDFVLEARVSHYYLNQKGDTIIAPIRVCCYACDQPRALNPRYRNIYKNVKGNIDTITDCSDYINIKDPLKIESAYSFKYNSSDKLTEIKTEEHIYKIEWL